MRTQLDIADDVLAAARELGRRQRRSIGEVISELARQALVSGAPAAAVGVRAGSAPFFGFDPFPPRGVVVTDELIDRLRGESGD